MINMLLHNTFVYITRIQIDINIAEITYLRQRIQYMCVNLYYENLFLTITSQI